jgi:hypothetical protein
MKSFLKIFVTLFLLVGVLVIAVRADRKETIDFHNTVLTCLLANHIFAIVSCSSNLLRALQIHQTKHDEPQGLRGSQVRTIIMQYAVKYAFIRPSCQP